MNIGSLLKCREKYLFPTFRDTINTQKYFSRDILATRMLLAYQLEKHHDFMHWGMWIMCIWKLNSEYKTYTAVPWKDPRPYDEYHFIRPISLLHLLQQGLINDLAIRA